MPRVWFDFEKLRRAGVRPITCNLQPETYLSSFFGHMFFRSPVTFSGSTLFSTTAPSEASAVKALLGQIPASGRLPVTIPDFAKRGDGAPMVAVK